MYISRYVFNRKTINQRSLMFVNISTYKLNIELILRQNLECDIAIKPWQTIIFMHIVYFVANIFAVTKLGQSVQRRFLSYYKYCSKKWQILLFIDFYYCTPLSILSTIPKIKVCNIYTFRTYNRKLRVLGILEMIRHTLSIYQLLPTKVQVS